MFTKTAFRYFGYNVCMCLLGLQGFLHCPSPLFPYLSSFYLLILSIIESGVLESPTVTVKVSVSPFNSVHFLLHIFEESVIKPFMFIIVIFYFLYGTFINISCPLSLVIILGLEPVWSVISLPDSLLPGYHSHALQSTCAVNDSHTDKGGLIT